jgi:hypothetical protein
LLLAVREIAIQVMSESSLVVGNQVMSAVPDDIRPVLGNVKLYAGHLMLACQSPEPVLIPRLLHLIWVGNAPMPGFMMKHLLCWRELLPTSWKIQVATDNPEGTDDRDSCGLMETYVTPTLTRMY